MWAIFFEGIFIWSTEGNNQAEGRRERLWWEAQHITFTLQAEVQTHKPAAVRPGTEAQDRGPGGPRPGTGMRPGTEARDEARDRGPAR